MRVAYGAASGRPFIPDWRFYIAFALFRYAAICQGILGAEPASHRIDIDPIEQRISLAIASFSS
jgi:aminoglycoside phosphotransferase (APT) family kinase protein